MSDYDVPDIPPDQGVREVHGEALRASDTERDAALHFLAGHYADGRLERAEFDERADAALAARTRDQLRALFADLPGPMPVPAPASAAVDAPRAADRMPAARAAYGGPMVRGFPPVFLFPVLLVFAVAAVLHGVPPFPLIPLVFILSRRRRQWNE